MQRTHAETRPMGIVVIAIVELTLTTAFIHLTLGGLLFTLNAVGYAVLAAAMVVIATVSHPLVRRFDWLPRVGLGAYTLATIGGYLVMGPYFSHRLGRQGDRSRDPDPPRGGRAPGLRVTFGAGPGRARVDRR